jgi:hypothetical protein
MVFIVLSQGYAPQIILKQTDPSSNNFIYIASVLISEYLEIWGLGS